ncbi:hypothetical protein [Streptomyces sp. NRRL S-495]|uniref:hypothetical protein n=1 Tax=Streptomyces sp. NRRL S-495 TaxID=1609133 RepID=UPI0005F8BCC6|nr:hypothetical protein [Streptomyces sp. NRRL S-495]KJY36620.1 hypothetical protein VR45_10885 [Streptomyces sp. NRRL S-495]
MAVTDIDILVGSQSPKEGWEKDKHDLNEGAGGEFLYLAWELNGTKKPVTDLYIVEGESEEPPRGYYKISTDLNKGAGGKYLYLSFSREGTKPITDLAVVAGDSEKVPAPAGFTRYDQDLNAGAKGKFIYICYKQQA